MNYIELFKKYSWLANVALLVLLSYVLASFTATYVRMRLFVPPSADNGTARQGRTAGAAPIKKDQNYYETIVTRNLFNSAAQGVNAIPSGGPALPSTMTAKLVGTVAGDPEYAYAVIDYNGKVDVYRVKDDIGGAIILAIERKKVIILHNGAKEELSMFVEQNQGGAGPSYLPGNNEVRQVGTGTYAIPEHTFKGAIQNMGQLLTQARVVPNLQGNRINGYRIFAITPGSLYANIGLQNGDIIYSVNGIRVSTPASAMELFQQLQNERRFTVNINRNGQSMTLNYTVQ